MSFPTHNRSGRPRFGRATALLLAGLFLVAAVAVSTARPAAADPAPVSPPAPTVPPAPGTGDTSPTSAPDGSTKGSISIDLGNMGQKDGSEKPSDGVVIILLLTVLAVAPALLVMLTSFTRIVIVLSLTRNALGLQGVPPNQVIIGLSLFLSFFVMAPTLNAINERALQPYLDGEITQQVAYDRASAPLRTFMTKQTDKGSLKMLVSASKQEKPDTADDVSMATLVPAFILSELKAAFIIAFVVFIPFLVIDLVVSSSLMSMGMFMLPPVLVSMPFKILLFVMVDGWALLVKSLVTSFH